MEVNPRNLEITPPSPPQTVERSERSERSAERPERIERQSQTERLSDQQPRSQETARAVAAGFAEETVSGQTINRAADEANNQLSAMNRHLTYGVHENTGMITVRIYDSETDELIRELPPESRLEALSRLQQILGLNVDDAI